MKRWAAWVAFMLACVVCCAPDARANVYQDLELGVTYKDTMTKPWGSGNWYKFEVKNSGEYSATVTGLVVKVAIYGPNLISNETRVYLDDPANPPETDAEKTERTKKMKNLQPGTYYMQVASIGGATGAYSVLVGAGGVRGAVVDLDPKFEGEPPRATVDASIIENAEWDWYVFTAESEYYGIELEYAKVDDATQPMSDAIIYLYESDQVTRVQEYWWVLTGDTWELMVYDWQRPMDGDMSSAKDTPHGTTSALTVGNRYYIKIGQNPGTTGTGGYRLYVGQSTSTMDEEPNLVMSSASVSDRTISPEGQDVLLSFTWAMTGKGTFDYFRIGVFAALTQAELFTNESPRDPSVTGGTWPDLVKADASTDDSDSDGMATVLGEQLTIKKLTTIPTGDQTAADLQTTFNTSIKVSLNPVTLTKIGIFGDGGDTAGTTLKATRFWMIVHVDTDDSAIELNEADNHKLIAMSIVDDSTTTPVDTLIAEIVSPVHGSVLSSPNQTVWGYVYDRTKIGTERAPTVDLYIGEATSSSNALKTTVQYLGVNENGMRKYRFYRDVNLAAGEQKITARAENYNFDTVSYSSVVFVQDSSSIGTFVSPVFFGGGTELRILNSADSEASFGIGASTALYAQGAVVPANKVTRTTLALMGFASNDVVGPGGLRIDTNASVVKSLRMDSWVTIGDEVFWVPLRLLSQTSGSVGSMYTTASGTDTVLFIYNPTSFYVTPQLIVRDAATEQQTSFTISEGLPPAGWKSFSFRSLRGVPEGVGSFTLLNVPSAFAYMMVGGMPLEVGLQNVNAGSSTLCGAWYSTKTSGTRYEHTLLAVHNPGLSAVTMRVVVGNVSVLGPYSVGATETKIINFENAGVPRGSSGGFTVESDGSVLASAWIYTTDAAGTVSSRGVNRVVSVRPKQTKPLAFYQTYSLTSFATDETIQEENAPEFNMTTEIAVYNAGITDEYPVLRFYRNDGLSPVVYNVPRIKPKTSRFINVKSEVWQTVFSDPTVALEGYFELQNTNPLAVAAWIVNEDSTRDYAQEIYDSE